MTNSLSVGAQAQAQAAVRLPKSASAASATSEIVGRYFQEARQAAAQIRVDFSQQAKGQARETVERLKKQISELSLVALVNPKGAARMIRALTRELGMAAKQYSDGGAPQAPAATEADAAGTTPREALAAAYLQSDPHAGDLHFVDDVRRMHSLLRTMMDGALSGAKADGHDIELDNMAKGFAESSDEIAKAAETIEGWSKGATPVAPFIPGTGGVLV